MCFLPFLSINRQCAFETPSSILTFELVLFYVLSLFRRQLRYMDQLGFNRTGEIKDITEDSKGFQDT
jgi:hypothetical protein